MVDIPVYENDRSINVVTTVNGQTVYSSDFLAYTADGIKLSFTRADGTILTPTFTVSGLGNPNGFDVTLTNISNSVVGEVLTIYGSTPIRRLNDYQQSGDYFASVVNMEEDTEFMIMQELRRDVDRSIKVPIGDPGIGDLPKPQANALLAWSSGLPFRIVNKFLANVGSVVAGAAGLVVIAKDTLSEIQDYLGITTKEEYFRIGDDPIVIICFGQSNMLAVTQGEGGDRSTEPGVYVWDQDFSGTHVKGWHEAGPDSPNWPWRGGNTNSGIFYSFARRLRRETKRKVYVIMHAAGGQPIAEFLPGGSMWAGLIASIRDAAGSPELAWRSTVPLADYILVHQGEADRDGVTTGAQWLSRFEAVIAALRTQQPTANNVWPARAETKVLVGELFRGGLIGGLPSDSRNTEIRMFEHGRDPYITSVSSHTYRSVDDLHISSRDLDDFGGNRYYEAAMRLPKPTIGENIVGLGSIQLPGKAVIQWGNITVNSGLVGTVVLPIPMANNSYSIQLTLSTSGGSAAVKNTATNRTPTQFEIPLDGTQNRVFHWLVIGQTP